MVNIFSLNSYLHIKTISRNREDLINSIRNARLHTSVQQTYTQTNKIGNKQVKRKDKQTEI